MVNEENKVLVQEEPEVPVSETQEQGQEEPVQEEEHDNEGDIELGTGGNTENI